jgi:hypothetical protein
VAKKKLKKYLLGVNEKNCIIETAGPSGSAVFVFTANR